MENSNICPNCGATNRNDSHFCINCGIQLTQNNVAVNEQNNVQQTINNNGVVNDQINNDDSKGTILGIISLVLYFAGSIIILLISYILPNSIRDYFSTLSGLSPISGIIIMIVGRVKYPTNKLLKIVMWAIIVVLF